MNDLRLLIEDASSTVLKIFIVYRIITWYGFAFGFPFCVLLFALYKRIIFRIFKIVPLTPYDICFLSSKIRNRFNIIGSLTLTDFNPEAIRNMIIERGMGNIRKLRYRLIYKFFNYYWREVSIEEAGSRIIICPHVKDDNEFNGILNAEVNDYIDVNNELPYKVKLIPYEGDSKKGIIIFHLDHLLSDGLGLISFICALSDDYSPDCFPSIMLNYKEEAMIKMIIEWILFPIYGLYALFLMFCTNSSNSPFRTYNKKHANCSFDFSLGRTMPLRTFNLNRKKKEMTFNQAVISSISLACKEICNAKGFVSMKHIKVMMPVGRKKVPSSIEKVKLSNEAQFMFLNTPLIENGSELHLVSRDLSLLTRNELLNNANIKWANIMGRLASFRVIDFFSALYCRNVDLILSNIPGPTKQLVYKGSRVEKINPIISPGRGIIFIIVMTYNDSFHVNIAIGDHIDVNAKEMLSKIEKGINDHFLIDKTD